ncbi:MAG: CBS domain-containing protein [Candidatus Aenigmatarchaeota archaeon]|nr:MAG: CBS domain-containing protein [Candidatus Aenigmarchaeota archaeon]
MVKVREVMKREVMKVSPQATLAEAARIMTNNRVGSLVVVENSNRPKDMVTESDITTVVANGLDPGKIKVSDLRKKKIKKRPRLVSVSPDDNILQVTKLMVKNGVQRVPVLDNGKLKGIIADKEILLISPELIEILSEKLKERVSLVPGFGEKLSGMCEDCGGYSDRLTQSGEQWVCPQCLADE